MFKMIGSTRYNNHDFEITDNKGLVNPIALGLDKGFYGGRVKQLGKTSMTKSQGLYMCIEDGKVIDLIKFDKEVVEQEVPSEPKYSDDVPLSAKEVHQPEKPKGSSLPRK